MRFLQACLFSFVAFVSFAAAPPRAKAPSSNVPGLIRQLEDKSWNRRQDAAIALAQVGARAAAAVPALTLRLTDPDYHVCHSAAYALGEIGPAAAPAVSALLVNVENVHLDPGARGAAVEAIGKIDASVKIPERMFPTTAADAPAAILVTADYERIEKEGETVDEFLARLQYAKVSASSAQVLYAPSNAFASRSSDQWCAHESRRGASASMNVVLVPPAPVKRIEIRQTSVSADTRRAVRDITVKFDRSLPLSIPQGSGIGMPLFLLEREQAPVSELRFQFVDDAPKAMSACFRIALFSSAGRLELTDIPQDRLRAFPATLASMDQCTAEQLTKNVELPLTKRHSASDGYEFPFETESVEITTMEDLLLECERAGGFGGRLESVHPAQAWTGSYLEFVSYRETASFEWVDGAWMLTALQVFD